MILALPLLLSSPLAGCSRRCKASLRPLKALEISGNAWRLLEALAAPTLHLRGACSKFNDTRFLPLNSTAWSDFESKFGFNFWIKIQRESRKSAEKLLCNVLYNNTISYRAVSSLNVHAPPAALQGSKTTCPQRTLSGWQLRKAVIPTCVHSFAMSSLCHYVRKPRRAA